MSWDVYLEDRTKKPVCDYGISPEKFKPVYDYHKPCDVPCYPVVSVKKHNEGGTYAIGGTDSADLNITYNYSQDFRKVIGYKESFSEWLTGKKAKDIISVLENAVNTLGVERSEDYWASDSGNAGYALNILLGWARQYPEAIFRVS